MRQRSLIWPSFWAGLGFLILVALGTWQVQRLHWKEGLIAAREAGIHAAPTGLPATLAAARALEFHPVRAEGQFLNDREFYLNAPSLRGDAGYHIITPLLLSSGATLLVDRGFVPTDRKAPETRAAGEPSGRVSVTGLLRIPSEGRPSWFTPDNDPARNQWFFIDVAAMASAQKLDRVLPFYIEADASPNPGGLPQGGQTVTELPNNHLQYAITWYSLAVVLVVIYVRFARRRLGGEGLGEEG
jgi:surfeit locus 1 family protein